MAGTLAPEGGTGSENGWMFENPWRDAMTEDAKNGDPTALEWLAQSMGGEQIYGKIQATTADGETYDTYGFFGTNQIVTTFTNNTISTSWYIPEFNKPDGSAADPVSLAPGNSTTTHIDAFTHPDRLGEIFKVKTGLDIFGITIDDGGEIRIGPAFLSDYLMKLNKDKGGGWISPPAPYWDKLFEKAGSKPSNYE